MTETRDAQVETVRSFNRAVTRRIGALEDRFLGRSRALGESRLLWEIGKGGTELRSLRQRLGLDSGYLSRLVGALEGEGLVRTEPSERDRRIRTARLTPAGEREARELDRLSDTSARSLLEGLSKKQCQRLTAAMQEVERLLRAGAVEIERVSPADTAARWCLERYYAELAERFEEGFELERAVPARDEELMPPRGVFLVARLDGEPIGSGCMKTLERGVGYIKRMWVAPPARGLGLGRRLLEALEAEAVGLGFSSVRLETNRALTEAQALYRSAGYVEIDPFIDEPYGDFWFEKELESQGRP